MLAVRFRIPWGIFGLISALSCWGASFGTVVPINGTVSDIALDERRNVVWAANFSAYRVEQVDIASKSLLTSLMIPMPPSAVALSPDHRFLVVGEYQKPDPAGFRPILSPRKAADTRFSISMRTCVMT